MSDEATPPEGSATEPPATGTEGNPSEPPKNDPPATGDSQDELRQQLARQIETNRKLRTSGTELARKAKLYDEATEAQKTEIQKAADRAAAAELRATNAEAERHRLLAAATNDLDPALIEFLGTGTEDEINERAKTMADIITAKVNAALTARGISTNGKPQAPQGGRRPAESLRPGGAPAGDAKPTTPDDWFRQMVTDQRGG